VVHGARIEALRRERASIRTIAGELGLSASVVARSVRRLEIAPS
jgi:IS30 family transposase